MQIALQAVGFCFAFPTSSWSSPKDILYTTNIFLFIINNIFITFTIRTNNIYNTLEYNKREEDFSCIHYYNLQKVALNPTKYKEK